MTKLITAILCISLFITSCEEKKTQTETSPSPQTQTSHKKATVTTPEEALTELKNGNQRFIDGKLTNTDYKEQIEQTKSDQHPHSILLSCQDSRIPPEIIFDQGIGNIFVVRNAGNIEDLNVLGGMEFATKIKGSKLIVVMGHNHCGAIKGAMEDAELGNLTQLVEQIKPAISKNENKDLVHDETSKNNVKMTIAHILERSPTISELVKENKVKIAGAYYDLTTGKVVFID